MLTFFDWQHRRSEVLPSVGIDRGEGGGGARGDGALRAGHTIGRTIDEVACMAWMRAVAMSGIASLAVCSPSAAAVQKVRFEVVGRTPAAGPQGAGSVAYYAPTKTLYVINKAQRAVDLFDLSDPAQPLARARIQFGGFPSGAPSAVATSTACGGVVAVALVDPWRGSRGVVAFYAPDGSRKYVRPAAAVWCRGWVVAQASDLPAGPSHDGGTAPRSIRRCGGLPCQAAVTILSQSS